MLVVGLTGGIGSGKSTVSALFSKKGVPVLDADVIAREITAPNEPAVTTILAHFHDKKLLKNGQLDRSRLREIIFSDKEEKNWLENLLHPLIRKEIESKLLTIQYAYCIVVIPLLFEVEPFPFVNRVVVVDTPELLQLERIMVRDQVSESQARAIIQAQVEREHRLNLADDVIVNDGSLQDLEPQVADLHQKYLAMSKSNN